MKNINIKFNRHNITCTGMADLFDNTDLAILNKCYFGWKDLNAVYKKYGMRRANLPELLSEGLASALFGWVRTNGQQINGLESSSCDLIDLKGEDGKQTIQLKGCSTTSENRPGPTSFGPRSEFDRLIFMHLDCDIDTAYFYELEADTYQNWKVNRNETIADQQAQGRRPRVTILSHVKESGLIPFKTYHFDREH